MTVEDMHQLMEWSYARCPPQEVDELLMLAQSNHPLDATQVRRVGDQLFIRAFATTGFTLWTRNFELAKLRHQDIEWDCRGRTPYNIPYFLVSLKNRKGWQRKGEHDGALSGMSLYFYFMQSSHSDSHPLPRFGMTVHHNGIRE
jgi:hypothetical protein